MIINYLKLDPQNEAKMGQYLTGGGGIWAPPKIQMLYFLTKNYLKINNYAKIIPVNPLSHTPRIKNLFKKPKKSDYQGKIGGAQIPPPLLNSTFRFPPNIQIINDHPQLLKIFLNFESFNIVELERAV